MVQGNREFDGEATVFDRVRRLSALAAFDPDAVDPATLAEVLEAVGGRYRRDVATAIERYAASDPVGIADHRETLLSEVDEYGGTAGASLARAVGHAVAVDPTAVGPLADRLAEGSRAVAAAEGLAVAASVDPDALSDRLSTTLAALSTGPDVAEPLSRALAELYVVDVADDAGPIRPRVGRALEADDPRERAGAIRTICRAAGADCQPAVDEFHRVIGSLAEDGGFLAPDDGLDRVVLAGTREVATGRPHALVPHLDTLLEVQAADDGDEKREGEGGESDVRSALVDVVAASAPAFERLLDEVEPGDGWLSRVRAGAGDDARTRAVLAGAAPAHVDVLVRREPAVRAILEEYPGLGAELVGAVTADRPDAAEWAIDPLLEGLDDPALEADAADRMARTLAALARTYPPVAGTVVDRLAAGGDGRDGAVLAVRELAETTPAALAPTSGPADRPVEELLVETVSTGGLGTDAAFALASLGARYPDRLAAVTGEVADAVRASAYRPESERNRAVNAVAAETVRAAPEAMHSVGLTVLDQVEGDADRLLSGDGDPNGLVALVGALCGEHERYADRLVEWFQAADESAAPGLLAALAEAGRHEGTPLAGHHSTLSGATSRLDDADRAAATTALAGAVATDPDPPASSTARLVDLLYDTSPAVRRAAAFGVGEWLAATGAAHEEPVRRLELVADAEEGTPVADLALVRAGERPAGEAVDALERVGLGDDRAPAAVAVDVLADLGTDPARAALAGIREDGDHRRVRAAADRELE